LSNSKTDSDEETTRQKAPTVTKYDTTKLTVEAAIRQTLRG
jgi:hypothetical protein